MAALLAVAEIGSFSFEELEDSAELMSISKLSVSSGAG